MNEENMKRVNEEIEILMESETSEVFKNSVDLAKQCSQIVFDSEKGVNLSVLFETFERLTKGIPLTEITNRDEDWELLPITSDPKRKIYDHKRYSGILREDTLGINDVPVKVRYIDTNRVVCVDTNGGIKGRYKGGVGASVYEEMDPITFPYYPPTDPAVVYVSNYKRNEAGIFQVIAVSKVRTVFGTIPIDRYFKYDGTEYVEITLEEFKKEMRDYVGEKM